MQAHSFCATVAALHELPDTTTQEQPMTATLNSPQDYASRVMLCTLNTSAWRATRLHKAETKAEQERHDSDAPKVLVRICEHKALADLAKLHAAAQTWHRTFTMPSVQDGMRLVPAAKHVAHSDRMHEFHEQHNAIVARFLADYDAERADAPRRLNGLYVASMWPTHDEVAGRFGFATRYLACPTEGAWGEWLAESARVAEDALRERVREALERVRDRCRADGPLYATVFSNLQELVEMVPDLNLTAAIDIKAVAAAAAPLAQTSVDACRDDEKLRKNAGDAAARILTMLGGVK